MPINNGEDRKKLIEISQQLRSQIGAPISIINAKINQILSIYDIMTTNIDVLKSTFNCIVISKETTTKNLQAIENCLFESMEKMTECKSEILEAMMFTTMLDFKINDIKKILFKEYIDSTNKTNESKGA